VRSAPVLRVARPTNDLEALLRFYRDGLGLEVLDRFEDHAGLDGLILGLPGAPYHLEFTHRRGVLVDGAPSGEHLLVLYLPDEQRWQDAVERLLRSGLDPVPSENPYWDLAGWTFEDPDGYRVVLQRGDWRGGG
jgi:catechol 2,3-dioxygenase-like lactoylglutathione lyase family enzyme